MFAQLVGLPGSGKSSIAARLAERHPEHVVHVVVQQERVGTLLRRRPGATLLALARIAPVAVVALLAARTPGSLLDRLAPCASLLNLLLRQRELKPQDRSDRILLFDEYVVQRLLGLFAHSQRPLSRLGLRWALLWLGRDRVLPVYLPLGAAEAEKRIEAREEGWPARWRSLEASRRSALLERQQIALDELFLLTPGGVRIPAAGELEERAADVLAILDRACTATTPRIGVGHFVFNLSSYSGAARQACSLAGQLEQVDSIVFDVERGRRHSRIDRLGDGSLRVVRLPRNPLRALIVIAEISFTHRLRIFHLHGLVGAGLVAGWILRRKLVLKTTLLGEDDFASLRGRFAGASWLWLARRAHLNIAPSAAIAERNAEAMAEWRIRRVPNGVVTKRSSGAAGDASGGPRTAPVFCVVGLVCERKRTHLAIEKFIAAYSEEPSARLYVVGPFGDSPELDEGSDAYYARCRALIPEAQADKVAWTGSLAADELQSLYESCLALLCFSEREGMPNVLLEAMAANCVPVTSEIAGVAREVIPDARCGFVIDDDAPLPSQAELVACSARQGPRQRVEEAFALDQIAREIEGIYRELVEGS